MSVDAGGGAKGGTDNVRSFVTFFCIDGFPYVVKYLLTCNDKYQQIFDDLHCQIVAKSQ